MNGLKVIILHRDLFARDLISKERISFYGLHSGEEWVGLD